MFTRMAFKRFVSRASPPGLIAAAVLAGSESKSDQEKKNLVRARELSIYSNHPQKSEGKGKEEEAESTLMAVVREVRQSLWAVGGQLGEATDQVNHVVETGKAHMSSTVQILRDEDHYLQRYGAIAAGGLVGYVFGLRRGWFRRVIYSTTGATAVAALCYPEEAKEYGSEGFRQAKHYVVIAYHFTNGVLRDYVGVQLPNLPADKDSAKTPSSAALMPPPSSAPSHISTGPMPMPPIDKPPSVSDSRNKQG